MIPARFRPYLIGAAFLAASLLAVLGYLAYAYFGPGGSVSRLSEELSADFAPLQLEAEDLYFPPEPELIPSTIPLKAPRPRWTEADAAPFWTDPATLDQGPLRAAAASEVDAILAPVR